MPALPLNKENIGLIHIKKTRNKTLINFRQSPTHLYLYLYEIEMPQSMINIQQQHVDVTFIFRHAEVMKKIIETVAEGGGELGVHMYPFLETDRQTLSPVTFCLPLYDDCLVKVRNVLYNYSIVYNNI